jgi:hypothetical protein
MCLQKKYLVTINEILVRFANIDKAKKILNYKIQNNTNLVVQEICLDLKLKNENSSNNAN